MDYVLGALTSVHKYPPTPEMYKLYDEALQSRDLKKIRENKDKIIDLFWNQLRGRRNKYRSGISMYPQPIPLMAYELHDHMLSLQSPAFQKPLYMDESEIVNGYALYKVDDQSFIMWEDEFEDARKLLEDNTPMTLDEFMKAYDDAACTDWAKMDPNGESFGGYWKYPEDSLEYQNAFDLTRDGNGRALYKLPYPKRLILWTIKIGCDNRQESVRYSNSLCEWVKRKSDQLTTRVPS